MTLAGWYPDPTVLGGLRFWDGVRWTAATAGPPVAVPIATATARGWAQRHPVWTALMAFWGVCLLLQWGQWLVPLLVVTAAAAWPVWRERRCRTRLAEDADRQNAQVLDGDQRGVFGNYPPEGS